MTHTKFAAHLSEAFSILALLALVTTGGCANHRQTARADAHDSRVALGATSSSAEDDADDGDDADGEDEEVEVALADVPAIVKQAAIAAVPGFVLEEAEREGEGDGAVYELEGKANGKSYEIEVTAAGVVKEIETNGDDDDDDGGDDGAGEGREGGA